MRSPDASLMGLAQGTGLRMRVAPGTLRCTKLPRAKRTAIFPEPDEGKAESGRRKAKVFAAANNPAATSQTATSRASVWTLGRGRMPADSNHKKLWTLDFEPWTPTCSARTPKVSAARKRCSTHPCVQQSMQRIRHAVDARRIARLRMRWATMRRSSETTTTATKPHWQCETGR